MTTDLTMLLMTAGLHWVLIMAGAMPRLAANGLRWGLGNREDGSEGHAPWVERAHRASVNLQENLILFAIVVLVVHVTGRANDESALGAQVFFWARVGHAVVYLAGIPVLRTVAWLVSLAGLLMTASVVM